MKNIKNTWKGIKSIISSKAKDAESPKIIKTKHGETITDTKLIADNLNNFFCSVAQLVQEKIKYVFKPFQDYSSKPCNDSFIITPFTEDEISKIISEFNYNKATGINSVPLKILKLAKQPISNHLSKIFNLSFSSGISPERLKTAKVTPNHRPILLLSNVNKIIVRLNRLCIW